MKVAIIGSGEMGAAVGGRLRERGCAVFTALAGRSEASAGRALAAGLIAIEDEAELVGGAEVVLSIVPPGQAGAVVARYAPALALAGERVVYADCNAVAPDTVRAIAETLAPTGCRFADAGIVGAPPRQDDPGPRIYVSGEAAHALLPLRDHGLDVRVIAGGVGAASALKMAYAGLTKGLTAVGAAMALAADAADVGEALRAELADSQPALLAWLSRQAPRAYPKAYRWVAEMEEIARFMPDPGAARIFEGAAALYEEIARDFAAEGGAGGRPARIDRLLAP